MIKSVDKRAVIFFVVLFILCLARCTFRCFPDNDLWARLLVGSGVIDGFGIMKQDLFSYLPTNPVWYDHEWGASVFIYAFFAMFQKYGLLLLKTLLTFAIMVLCFKTIKLREPKFTHPYNLFFYVLIFLGSSYVFNGTVRCHLFSFFFFSLFLYLLERVRIKGFRHWWVFPLLMFFWVNIHGGCVSGLGLLGMYLVGELLNKKPVSLYLKALLTSCLVLFINPWGAGYVVFLFKATTMARDLILEWGGTFENNQTYYYFKAYMFLMCFVGLLKLIKTFIKKQNFDWTKWIVLAVTLYLSIAHIKHQPFFVLASGVFLYDDFYELFGGCARAVLNKIPNMSDKIIGRLILIKDIFIYFLVIWFSLILLTSFKTAISFKDTAYPYYAVEFIKQNNLQGKLFTNFDWGSYASYKLYPYVKTAMDGRYEECFDPELIFKMNSFHMLNNDHWYDIIEMYPPDIMVIEKKYPVYKELLKKTGWFLVFENNLSGVFVSEKLKKDKYIYPPSDIDYYNRTMFDKQFSFVKRIKKE
ncbi:hypothetical protein IKQ26_00615 [bacterium]|nr:hypothetical protein [bacterium]